MLNKSAVRIDKWLWAARFFKTRSLAGKACELGRVSWNGQTAKAARDVRVGDMLRVKNEGGEFEVEVLGLSEVRGPAVIAQGLYRETEVSKVERAKASAERKAMGQFDVLRTPGRPSKRDRRLIHRFREED
jgi:ribosome-associated heat shock protein Hsp15